MKDDTILTIGLLGLGGYLLYTISKPVEQAVYGVAGGVQGLGQGVSYAGQGLGYGIGETGLAAGSIALDIAALTRQLQQSLSGIVGVTGEEGKKLIAGVGETGATALEATTQIAGIAVDTSKNLRQTAGTLTAIPSTIAQGFLTFIKNPAASLRAGVGEIIKVATGTNPLIGTLYSPEMALAVAKDAPKTLTTTKENPILQLPAVQKAIAASSGGGGFITISKPAPSSTISKPITTSVQLAKEIGVLPSQSNAYTQRLMQIPALAKFIKR
jgi:hypothetical protein